MLTEYEKQGTKYRVLSVGPHHMCLFQSASFFTPTLGNKLRLLTNNGAMISEPLAHKNAPNSCLGTNWSPTIKEYTSVARLIGAHPHTGQTLLVTLPGALCPQRNHWSAHSVFTTINVLGNGAQMGYAALALHWPTAPLMG